MNVLFTRHLVCQDYTQLPPNAMAKQCSGFPIVMSKAQLHPTVVHLPFGIPIYNTSRFYSFADTLINALNEKTCNVCLTPMHQKSSMLETRRFNSGYGGCGSGYGNIPMSNNNTVDSSVVARQELSRHVLTSQDSVSSLDYQNELFRPTASFHDPYIGIYDSMTASSATNSSSYGGINHHQLYNNISKRQQQFQHRVNLLWNIAQYPRDNEISLEWIELYLVDRFENNIATTSSSLINLNHQRISGITHFPISKLYYHHLDEKKYTSQIYNQQQTLDQKFPRSFHIFRYNRKKDLLKLPLCGPRLWKLIQGPQSLEDPIQKRQYYPRQNYYINYGTSGGGSSSSTSAVESDRDNNHHNVNNVVHGMIGGNHGDHNSGNSGVKRSASSNGGGDVLPYHFILGDGNSMISTFADVRSYRSFFVSLFSDNISASYWKNDLLLLAENMIAVCDVSENQKMELSAILQSVMSAYSCTNANSTFEWDLSQVLVSQLTRLPCQHEKHQTPFIIECTDYCYCVEHNHQVTSVNDDTNDNGDHNSSSSSKTRNHFQTPGESATKFHIVLEQLLYQIRNYHIQKMVNVSDRFTSSSAASSVAAGDMNDTDPTTSYSCPGSSFTSPPPISTFIFRIVNSDHNIASLCAFMTRLYIRQLATCPASISWNTLGFIMLRSLLPILIAFLTIFDDKRTGVPYPTSTSSSSTSFSYASRSSTGDVAIDHLIFRIGILSQMKREAECSTMLNSLKKECNNNTSTSTSDRTSRFDEGPRETTNPEMQHQSKYLSRVLYYFRIHMPLLAISNKQLWSTTQMIRFTASKVLTIEMVENISSMLFDKSTVSDTTTKTTNTNDSNGGSSENIRQSYHHSSCNRQALFQEMLLPSFARIFHMSPCASSKVFRVPTCVSTTVCAGCMPCYRSPSNYFKERASQRSYSSQSTSSFPQEGINHTGGDSTTSTTTSAKKMSAKVMQKTFLLPSLHDLSLRLFDCAEKIVLPNTTTHTGSIRSSSGNSGHHNHSISSTTTTTSTGQKTPTKVALIEEEKSLPIISVQEMMLDFHDTITDDETIVNSISRFNDFSGSRNCMPFYFQRFRLHFYKPFDVDIFANSLSSHRHNSMVSWQRLQSMHIEKTMVVSSQFMTRLNAFCHRVNPNTSFAVLVPPTSDTTNHNPHLNDDQVSFIESFNSHATSGGGGVGGGSIPSIASSSKMYHSRSNTIPPLASPDPRCRCCSSKHIQGNMIRTNNFDSRTSWSPLLPLFVGHFEKEEVRAQIIWSFVEMFEFEQPLKTPSSSQQQPISTTHTFKSHSSNTVPLHLSSASVSTSCSPSRVNSGKKSMKHGRHSVVNRDDHSSNASSSGCCSGHSSISSSVYADMERSENDLLTCCNDNHLPIRTPVINNQNSGGGSDTTRIGNFSNDSGDSDRTSSSSCQKSLLQLSTKMNHLCVEIFTTHATICCNPELMTNMFAEYFDTNGAFSTLFSYSNCEEVQLLKYLTSEAFAKTIPSYGYVPTTTPVPDEIVLTSDVYVSKSTHQKKPNAKYHSYHTSASHPAAAHVNNYWSVDDEERYIPASWMDGLQFSLSVAFTKYQLDTEFKKWIQNPTNFSTDERSRVEVFIHSMFKSLESVTYPFHGVTNRVFVLSNHRWQILNELLKIESSRSIATGTFKAGRTSSSQSFQDQHDDEDENCNPYIPSEKTNTHLAITFLNEDTRSENILVSSEYEEHSRSNGYLLDLSRIGKDRQGLFFVTTMTSTDFGSSNTTFQDSNACFPIYDRNVTKSQMSNTSATMIEKDGGDSNEYDDDDEVDGDGVIYKKHVRSRKRKMSTRDDDENSQDECDDGTYIAGIATTARDTSEDPYDTGMNMTHSMTKDHDQQHNNNDGCSSVGGESVDSGDVNIPSVHMKQTYGLQSNVIRSRRTGCTFFMTSMIKYLDKIIFKSVVDEKDTNDFTSRKRSIPTALISNRSRQVYKHIASSTIRSIRQTTNDINECIALLLHEMNDEAERHIDSQRDCIIKWNSVSRNMSINIDIADGIFTDDDRLRVEIYNQCELQLRKCIHSEIVHKDPQAKLEFYLYVKPDNAYFVITLDEHQQLQRFKSTRSKSSSSSSTSAYVSLSHKSALKELSRNTLSTNTMINREKIYFRVYHRCFGMASGNTDCIEKKNTPLFISAKNLLTFVKSSALHDLAYAEICSIVKQVVDNVMDERGDSIVPALVSAEVLNQTSKRHKKHQVLVFEATGSNSSSSVGSGSQHMMTTANTTTSLAMMSTQQSSLGSISRANSTITGVRSNTPTSSNHSASNNPVSTDFGLLLDRK